MNKLQFLGTGAADFAKLRAANIPDRLDADARRSSAALLHGHMLIDCGPHTLDCLRILGIAQECITDLFITHLHSDHFDPENVRTLAKNRPGLRIFVSDAAMMPEIPGAVVIPMEKYRSYTVADGVTVTAVDANHDADFAPQHYLFDFDGKKLLYALDGAWFINKSYNFLKGCGLSVLVIDATCGDYEGDFRMAEHNSIPMIRLMLPSLRTVGIVNDNTKIVLSHLAPSLHDTHENTVNNAARDGLSVAYDGMEMEF
ncbi:MAG: hypothetical protein E7632_12470 [Ruminococcaceae bacterium]|nr:hypothetical protein [Oscillospiraceae bacterium]